MSRTFVHDGHTYTFTRHRGVVTVTRDDGCQLWSTYPTYSPYRLSGDIYAAHQPALATITEAKHLIVHGHTDHGTYVHQVVWALTEQDARRMREEMDDGHD